MAAFKASARSLDQGVGAVLQALDETGVADRTLIVFTTDHGLPFPGANATLTDRGTGVLLLLRGPGGFHGGHVTDSLVSHVDLYPTLLALAGARVERALPGRSLLPLTSDRGAVIRDELFTELTYHAAYDPQRAIRTRRHKLIRHYGDRLEPVLPNIDDGPTKELLLAAGLGTRPRPRTELYDLLMDPGEMRNLAEDPGSVDVLGDLEARLEAWMRETADPLLDGPVPVPAGGVVNPVDGVRADGPLLPPAS